MGQPLIDRSVERFDENGNQTVFAISPFGASETREERLARWEKLGIYDPNCEQCREIVEHPLLDPFMPRHKAMATCRSGKQPHCTCDTCF
jgi:hypothetical protein